MSNIKDEYMLLPWGIATETGRRYVAEQILNKDGQEIFGTLTPPDEFTISLSQIGMTANLQFRSNGLYLVNLKFIQNKKPSGVAVDTDIAKSMREALELGCVPKAMSIGKENGKLKIISECKITGFFIGPAMPAINRVNPPN